MASARLSSDYSMIIKLIRKKVYLVEKHIKDYENLGNISDKIEIACGINQLCDLLIKLQFIQEGHSLNANMGRGLSWAELPKAGEVLGYTITIPEVILANEKSILSWVTKVDNSWVNNTDIDLFKKLVDEIKLWFTRVIVGGIIYVYKRGKQSYY